MTCSEALSNQPEQKTLFHIDLVFKSISTKVYSVEKVVKNLLYLFYVRNNAFWSFNFQLNILIYENSYIFCKNFNNARCSKKIHRFELKRQIQRIARLLEEFLNEKRKKMNSSIFSISSARTKQYLLKRLMPNKNPFFRNIWPRPSFQMMELRAHRYERSSCLLRVSVCQMY